MQRRYVPRSTPVCVISNEFYPHRGGIAVFAEEVAEAAAARGHPVEVWAPRHARLRDLAHQRYRLHPVDFRGSQDLSCQLRLAVALLRRRRHLRSSIVYLPDPGAMLAMTYLHLLPAFRAHRLVLTFHGSEILRFGRVPTLALLIDQLIRRAHLVTAPSAFTLGLLRAHFPSAATKARLTPGAPRTFRSDPGGTQPRPPDRQIVLTVGRIHPRKGQHHAIAALAALPEKIRQRLEYWVVGQGEKEGYGERLRHEAAAAGFPVRFFGDVDDRDLPSFYRAADLFTLTSIYHRNSVEGFGLVFLEASSFGVPVVAHSVGGVPEAVRAGFSGLLVPLGEPAQLTEAYRAVLEDRTLRERLRNGARARAGEWSWAATTEILLDGNARAGGAGARGRARQTEPPLPAPSGS